MVKKACKGLSGIRFLLEGSRQRQLPTAATGLSPSTQGRSIPTAAVVNESTRSMLLVAEHAVEGLTHHLVHHAAGVKLP